MTGPTLPSYVYRLLDEAGTLLYVGLADNVKGRIAQHALDKPWWHEVSSVDVQQYPDREAAMEAERAAIQQEQPRENIEGTPRKRRPRPRTRLADTDRLTAEGVAELLGGSRSTVSSYASRGQMPKPTPCPCCGTGATWPREQIEQWKANRPGRTGRPRKDTGETSG